jgi:hypothetical protein
MEIPGLNLVTHDSSVREIMNAINLAGAYIAAANLHHRRYDVPRQSERQKFLTYSGFAWVKPADIGPTSTRNTRLLEKLKRMVESGILEMRYSGSLPRFRVKYSYRNPKYGRVRHPPDRTILGQH